MEYWKLNDLKNIIVEFEDSFGTEIEKYKADVDYNNILIFSYARSIIIAKEILCLLNNGFPDGALTLARRLYEQMIILYYLENHKSDSNFQKVVERYFDDQNFRAYDSQVEWCDLYKNDSGKKIVKQKRYDIANKYLTKKNVDCQIKYMRTHNYWWTGDETMTFNKLSKCFDDPFAKILYRRACVSTHASAMGDFALLGRMNVDGNNIYTGATFYEFSAPLLLTTYSFYHSSKFVFCNFGIKKSIEKLEILMNYYMKCFFEDLRSRNNG